MASPRGVRADGPPHLPSPRACVAAARVDGCRARRPTAGRRRRPGSATRRADAARSGPPQGRRPRPRLRPAGAPANARAPVHDGAADAGRAQGGEGAMSGRVARRSLLLSALLVLGMLAVAWGQTAPVPGLDKLTPEERALAERNQERWQKSEERRV